MTTTAVYCRISDDKVGAGLGVERQQADCRELAERLGWTVADVFIDNDLSASTGKPRPAYRRLLAALREGRFGAVIAWHPDRLHRRPVELEEFIEVCESRAVQVQTVRAGSVDLATASGRMVARMLGAAARHETEHASERIRAQKARAVADGRWIGGGQRPFGYEFDGSTVRDEEAKHVTDAATRVLAGESLYKIAKEWRAAGLTGTSGGDITPMGVRRLLISPRSAGFLTHRGEIVGRAPWPSIIPEPEWRQLRAMLTDPARNSVKGARTLRWVGSSLYRCGRCNDGTTLRSTTGHSGTVKVNYPIYRCRSMTHCSVPAGPLDEYVHGVVRERLSRPDLGDLLPTAPDDSAELRVEADGLRARLDEAADMYAQGELDRRGYTRAREGITGRLDAVTAALAARAESSPLVGIVNADDPVAYYDAAPVDRQRAIIDSLMTVTISTGRRGRQPAHLDAVQYVARRVTIDWRTPE